VGEIRNARACVREAWRQFRWTEYRPFGWILLAELVFLFFAFNLGTTWGMAGAGWIFNAIDDSALHYPASYLFLASVYARVEAFLFAVAGSFLIPLSLARIGASASGAPATSPEISRRAARAYPVALAGYLLSFGLLLAWEFLVSAGPRHWFGALLGGLRGDIVTWLFGVLVACAIAAIFFYVPIRAVDGDPTFPNALGGGIREGIRSLVPTLLIVLTFAWASLLVLAPAQLLPGLLVTRFRPELNGVLIVIAAVLNSFVNYFIYSATMRLHRLHRQEAA